MGNYFRNEDAEPQINKIIAADQALFTAITFPQLIPFPPLICSTTLDRWPDEELSVNVKHWAQKVPKADSVFHISKPWLFFFPELACSLDKFNVELGGWERAEQDRWVLQGFERLARDLFCCHSPSEITAWSLENCPSTSRHLAVSGKGSHGLPILQLSCSKRVFSLEGAEYSCV